MQKIQEDYKDKGVQVVMVNIDIDRFRVGPFLKKNPATAAVLLTNGKVEGSYGVQGIPLNVLLDRQGMIRCKQTGFHGDAQMRELLDALLSEPASAAATQ